MVINICGIFYGIYYLIEVPNKIEATSGEMELINKNSMGNDETQVELPKMRTLKCSEIFTLNVLKDGVRVVVRKRNHNGRTVVVLLFLMTILYNGIFSGTHNFGLIKL